MHVRIEYELAFVSSVEQVEKPAIEFIIATNRSTELIEQLKLVLYHKDNYVRAYLREDDANWRMPEADLFQGNRFGFGDCGYFTIRGESLHLRIELSGPPHVYHATLTLWILLCALGWQYDEGRTTRWTMFIETRCEHVGSGYGHAVSGHISSEAHAWLKSYASTCSQTDAVQFVALPEKVILAMRQAFAAVSGPALVAITKPWEFRGSVREGGAFILSCPGDACDVGVYPDDVHDGDYNEIQCHNLDTAEQQLTLVAGIAALAMQIRS